MLKQKSNGEGSIYQRKDGRWCAAISIGYTPAGKIKRKYLYGSTKTEVRKKLIQMQSDIEKNYGYINHEKMTLEEWGKVYLFNFVKNSVSPSTFQRKESVYRIHIAKSNLGSMRLSNIKPYHIQALLNEKTHLVESSIKKIYQLLDEIFRKAVLNHLIWKSPVIGITTPKSKKNSKEIRILSLEEQKRYIAALEGEYLRVLFLTALFTGMRKGEILSLTWDDINYKDNYIKVNKSLKRVKIFNDSASHYENMFQKPKTKSSNREVPLISSLKEELRKHHIQQKELKLKSKNPKFNNHNLVFCSQTGTVLIERNLYRIHQRIQKNIGIEKLTFHALRHTFASRMFEQGEDVKKVSAWLGHSTIQMSYDLYIHITKKSLASGIDKIEELYKSLV